MPNAHLYLFVDASPSDWLVDGHGSDWHTIAWLAFQSAPSLQERVDEGAHFQEILNSDEYFQDFFQKLYNKLPQPYLKKWGKSGLDYREDFYKAFSQLLYSMKPLVNGYSFQEETLRASKNALLREFTDGVVDNSVKFSEYLDDGGKRWLSFSFVSFNGFCSIEEKESQVLPLLLMAWGIRSQYQFYWKEIVGSRKYGFDNLAMTVVSDKLSGDDNNRKKWEEFLKRLVFQIPNASISLTRSLESDIYPADLFVDNMAGWLNASIKDTDGEDAKRLLSLPSLDMLNGWYELLPSAERLKGTSALKRLAPIKKKTPF